MVLDPFLCVCWCDSAVGLWTQQIQANVDYCYVWRREETRRVHFALPWTQASKPALTLVWPRRGVPRRFTCFFFQPSLQAQHDDLLLLLCVLSYDT